MALMAISCEIRSYGSMRLLDMMDPKYASLG